MGIVPVLEKVTQSEKLVEPQDHSKLVEQAMYFAKQLSVEVGDSAMLLNVNEAVHSDQRAPEFSRVAVLGTDKGPELQITLDPELASPAGGEILRYRVVYAPSLDPSTAEKYHKQLLEARPGDTSEWVQNLLGSLEYRHTGKAKAHTVSGIPHWVRSDDKGNPIWNRETAPIALTDMVNRYAEICQNERLDPNPADALLATLTPESMRASIANHREIGGE